MENTRRTLERVPFEKSDWKPHAKSSSLGALAAHLAVIPWLAVPVLTEKDLDIAAERGKHAPPASTSALLATFDQNVADARSALGALQEEEIRTPWTLRFGDRIIWTQSRHAAYRTLVMHHMVHHRAQLGVYLRLNDVPVPRIYGPSADEGI